MLSTSSALKNRGVVLGGGGVAGLAWHIGLLMGLLQGGVDLGEADEVIGTSAGAFAGTALLDDRGLKWAYDRQFQPARGEISAALAPDAVETFAAVLTSGMDDAAAGRRLGAYASGASAITPEDRASVVRSRLERTDWPSEKLLFTAIDADSGELHLLGASSGVDLVDAANASGAAPGVWPVVRAAGRRWIDGGSVSVTNAHLAARFRRCVVISPMTTNFSGVTVHQQVDSLPDTTSALLIHPDENSLAAIGRNPFDADRRSDTALAGRNQGAALAARTSAFWLSSVRHR